VLNDDRAVRKSIAAAFRHTFRSLAQLLISYVVVTIFAAIVLLAGLWLWMKLVAPENIVGAFAIGQITLFLLLIPRFWQRGIAVSYWQERMMAPFIPTRVVEPSSVPVIMAPESPAGDLPPAGAPCPSASSLELKDHNCNPHVPSSKVRIGLQF
jgi:ABC-type multidrug transport system fused ATPase/permease subunit